MRKKNTFQLTIKISEDLLCEEGAGAEVDQLELAGVEIYEDVLVFNVAVNDAALMNCDYGFDDLSEEASRMVLRQHAVISDVVEQILTMSGALHNQNVTVVLLEVIQQFDGTRNMRHLFQKRGFQWNNFAVHFHQIIDFVFTDVLDCNLQRDQCHC